MSTEQPATIRFEGNYVIHPRPEQRVIWMPAGDWTQLRKMIDRIRDHESKWVTAAWAFAAAFVGVAAGFLAVLLQDDSSDPALWSLAVLAAALAMGAIVSTIAAKASVEQGEQSKQTCYDHLDKIEGQQGQPQTAVEDAA